MLVATGETHPATNINIQLQVSLFDLLKESIIYACMRSEKKSALSFVLFIELKAANTLLEDKL